MVRERAIPKILEGSLAEIGVCQRNGQSLREEVDRGRADHQGGIRFDSSRPGR
jgi:hypothetical protein